MDMTERRKYKHRLTDLDVYLFFAGTHYEIYEKMGAHVAVEDGVSGVYFAVWAPNAKEVSVVGDFNNWVPGMTPMGMVESTGIYDVFVPGLTKGDLYKYTITTFQGSIEYKADPYGNQAELRPNNASVVADINGFDWKDGQWKKAQTLYGSYKKPMSIYEVHLGSWKRAEDGGFCNYRQLAHELAEYVTYMGYTHVELIGIAEHPFDGSWGYQVTGYYAPTARYGSPEEFMYFVDYLHQHQIGVILDWVPAHFPKDSFALARFDGTPLYEHPDPRRGEHADWGTYIFNYTKPEVANFLVANALFWIEKFHVDGLRVDAVASMLYLDYGKKDGEWLPAADGSNKNYDAINFLKHLNSILIKRNPGAIMIAEESTAFPKVSAPAEYEGLGFTYKWNMGWMHDFLEYMKTDPYYRQYDHNKVTFSFSYAYSENFILVLSHDEVVHLKCSMINKMPGEMPQKFANLRAAYGFMMTHPGKKLLFMGQDFAQLQEWSEERALDWYLLDTLPEHRQLNNYVRDLLHLYKTIPALYELDHSPEGFQWINGADAQRNMLTICRMSENGKDCLLIHYNFSPVSYDEVTTGALCPGTYTEIFNSNSLAYGGDGLVNDHPIKASDEGWDFKDYSITFKVGPYAVCIFKFDYIEVPKKLKDKEDATGIEKAGMAPLTALKGKAAEAAPQAQPVKAAAGTAGNTPVNSRAARRAERNKKRAAKNKRK